MGANDYWDLFLETGAPECYVAYRAARHQEEDDVSERTGTGAAQNGVQ